MIATGVVTTGVILHKAADGSFAVNQGVKDLVSHFSPGYREQQKRERTAKESLDRNQANVQKSIENNVGKPSPDGTPDPKGDISTIGKIVIGTGLAAEAGKGIYENIIKGNDSQGTGTDSSNENKTSSQPVIKSADAKDTNTESNLPVSTWSPFPQKEDKQIQIPLRQ